MVATIDQFDWRGETLGGQYRDADETCGEGTTPMIEVSEMHDGKAALCREILDDLPEWFGIADAKAAYVAASTQLPMLAGRLDGEVVAFVSLKPHTDLSVELYVLGVKRRFHRRKVGSALVDAAERFAREHGRRFLTVKTLAAVKADPHYAGTRRFYEAMGFLPIEVFPTLWDADNPCLLMLKSL
jgi:ribosomal protein S18 acetylase RimI-like enzyme